LWPSGDLSLLGATLPKLASLAYSAQDEWKRRKRLRIQAYRIRTPTFSSIFKAETSSPNFASANFPRLVALTRHLSHIVPVTALSVQLPASKMSWPTGPGKKLDPIIPLTASRAQIYSTAQPTTMWCS
jgi:hypothetical protein